MSKKLNRLRRRMEIEAHRVRKRERQLDEYFRRVQLRELDVAAERRTLDRSVALRIKVERDFDRPVGDAFAVNVVVYPDEYRLLFKYGSPSRAAQNMNYYALLKGREAGDAVADLILACLKGELEEYRKAR